MRTWEILAKVIRRHDTERVAQILNVSADYVRRWRREPVSDEAPLASGQRSPLDRVCDLIDAAFLVNPLDASLIVEYVIAHFQRLLKTHAVELPTHRERAHASANILKEATEAVNALNLNGVNNDTLAELIQLRDIADKTIAQCRATINSQVQETIQ